MALIQLVGVHKAYGGSIAVNSLDLTAHDGELLVFLGPSGCGKTTTINMIAGLIQPTSGKIQFDDEDVTMSSPYRRNASMVFQSSLLYPHLDARRNILMSLRRSALSDREKSTRIDEVVRFLDIAGLMSKLPSQMSGGERQRVAMAKAVVRHPSVFLLDEPMAGLDAALRLSVRSELVNLQKRLKTTMIFVTHDQVEAMTMGDRIAVMRDGRLEQIGSPVDVYRKPASLFVAGFVGSPPMNFFAGEIGAENGAPKFMSAQLSVALANSYSRTSGLLGRNVVLGVRPHAVAIVGQEVAEAGVGTIFAVEHLGSETVVIIETPDATKVRAIGPHDFVGRVGEIVKYRIAGASALLFDPQSERAIAA